MLSNGTSNHDTDLAEFIRTTKLPPADVKVGDIVVEEFGTWHVHTIETQEYRGEHDHLKGKTGTMLRDIDNNGTWTPNDWTVTIIARDCLKKPIRG